MLTFLKTVSRRMSSGSPEETTNRRLSQPEPASSIMLVKGLKKPQRELPRGRSRTSSQRHSHLPCLGEWWETLKNQMTTAEKIQDICDRIARDFRPAKIIVFGSHAYGTPGPFSDLDLLVVMPFEGSPLQQAARIISRINPDMGVDLIVRTPAQVRERLAINDAFMREILERGRVAYEANHA